MARWFLLSTILLIFVGGCAHRPPPVEPPHGGSLYEWLPALRERSEYWKSYQARVHLRAQTTDKKFNLDALVLAKLPDQFRLEGFRLGQTVGVLTMNHGQSCLFVPSERVLYTGARSEDLIDHFLGITLPLDVFGYSLSASLPPDQLDSLQIIYQAPEWAGYAKPSPDGWSYVWRFSSFPPKMQSVSARRGALTYSIRYEPPVPLAAQEVPQKITFSSEQWEIELTVQEIAPAPALLESIFEPDFVKEIPRIDLNSPHSHNR
jgi:hypothetical protein